MPDVEVLGHSGQNERAKRNNKVQALCSGEKSLSDFSFVSFPHCAVCFFAQDQSGSTNKGAGSEKKPYKIESRKKDAERVGRERDSVFFCRSSV